MNHLLNPLLILLGLAMAGYAIYFKNATHSPRSAWENSLANAARLNHDEFARQFNRIMDRVESGWNWAILLGVAVVVVACFIKSGRGDGKP